MLNDTSNATTAVPRGADRAAALVVCLGAFAVVLAAAPSTVFDLERFAVPKELALHVTALLLLLLLMPGWRRIEVGVVDALLVGFIAWSGLSALFAANHWLALHAFSLSFSALIVYLASRRLARAGLTEPVLAGLAAAAVLGALIGLAEAYGLTSRLLGDSRPPGGTFGNRNFLAHLTTIAIPILLGFTLRARRRVSAVLALLGLGIGVGAIVLTRSRGAWLGAAAAMAAMAAAVVLGKGRALVGSPRGRLMGVGMVSAVAIAAVMLLPNTLSWRSHTPYVETLAGLANYQEGSGRGRLIQYRNSLHMLEHHTLLGVGPGNWFVHYPRVTTPGDPSFAGYDPIPTNPWPSSDWVAMLTERGIIGALLFFLAGVAAGLTAVRRALGDEPEQAARAVMMLGILTAAAVTGMFDAVLLLAPPAFFVFAAAGVLLPDTRPVLSRALEGRARRVVRGVVLAIAILATLTTAAQLAAIFVAGDGARTRLEAAAHLDPGSFRLQLLLSRRGPCSQRLPHARAAEALLPYHAAPREALRTCGVRPPEPGQ